MCLRQVQSAQRCLPSKPSIAEKRAFNFPQDRSQLWGRTRGFMGLFAPGFEKGCAPQGPLACAKRRPTTGQYCLLWGGALCVSIIHTSPKTGSQQATTAAGKSTIIPPFWIRPSHLNWEEQKQSTSKQVATSNHHIPLYPIHIPPIPHDAMIQRLAWTLKHRGPQGGFMKIERTLTRTFKVQSTHHLSVAGTRLKSDGALPERPPPRSP